MVILLFLLNLSGSIGPTAGLYFPALDSLNDWLLDKIEAEEKIGSGATFGIATKVHIGNLFAIEADADYFKAKSLNEERKLLLVPIDVYLSYRHMIVPKLVYFYVGAGYGFCFTKYEDLSFDTSSWGSGFPVKASIEFLPTSNLGVELLGGFRFTSAPNIELEDPRTRTSISLPMGLWGGFFKVIIKREL